MSLLDDVSIVVTPNGYKAGTLFGVIPVPSEGAELVTNGDFATDSDWNKGTGWSISNGELVGNNATSITYQGISAQPNTFYKVTFTVSNYVSGNVLFQFNGGSNSGTPRTSVGTYTEYIATDASVNGNFSITRTQNFTGSIENVSVKEYTASDMDVTRATDATRVDENGLVEKLGANVPRIDYTGGGCPHILAEPQRTNLVTYSEDFSDSSWSKSDVTVEGGFTSPSGDESAYKLKEGSATINHQMYASISGIAGNTYTLSGIFKKGERDIIQLVYGGAAFDEGNTYCNFDLSNGVLGSGLYLSASITLISNGWYRCEFTATKTTTGNFNITYAPKLTSTSSRNAVYTGDGTSGVYIWGAQVEVGSYATSYIPTSGSTVTRNQDIFTRDGIGSLINSEEGVLFLEMAALTDDNARRTVSLSDGSNSNRVILRYGDSSNRVQVFIKVGGATNGNIINDSYTITNFLKIAYKWKAGDFALWINGTEVGTSADATSFGTGVLTELQFNQGDGTGDEYFGKVKQLQVYDTALTDTQLAALTS